MSNLETTDITIKAMVANVKSKVIENINNFINSKSEIKDCINSIFICRDAFGKINIIVRYSCKDINLLKDIIQYQWFKDVELEKWIGGIFINDDTFNLFKEEIGEKDLSFPKYAEDILWIDYDYFA